MTRRVPIVLQMTSTECGAACLAMLLGYHGRRTRLAEARTLTTSGRDGSTALGIANAARSLGLEVRAFRAATPDLGALTLPAIVHWQQNHFLVVERWSTRRVDVVDPASGRRRLSPQEFAAGFSGLAMTFTAPRPLAPAPAGGDPRRQVLATALRTRGIRRLLLQIVGVSLLLQGLALALPLFTKVVVDDLLPTGSPDLLAVLALGAFGWVASHSLANYLRAALVIHAQARLDAQLMLGFFEHLMHLPFRFLRQRASGDLLLRLGSNAMLREIVTTQSVAAVFDSLLVIVMLVALLVASPIYCALALGIAALQLSLLVASSRWLRRLAGADLQAQAQTQSYAVEALDGIASVKAAGVEGRAIERFRGLFLRQLTASVRRNHGAAILETLQSCLRIGAPLGLLLVGAVLTSRGELSLGSMLALNALAASFLGPLASLVALGQGLQVATAHLDRITDVLEAAPEQAPGGRTADRLAGRIELRSVEFRYDATGPAVLRDVSLVVEPGEKLALVGPTGSGKSTLANVMLGLEVPAGGEVLVDDTPLRDLDLPSVRRRFGVVLQEPGLFSGSVHDNITFHDPAIQRERVVAAATTAAIHEEIAAMPMGYETLLADGGTGLSGGQRQRLALARALVHDPQVLLLDEATSHLDAVTEARVEAGLARLRCTRIVIAHRLSTVRSADRIVVLDRGTIVEQGTHAQLMAQRGLYAALVQEQLAG